MFFGNYIRASRCVPEFYFSDLKKKINIILQRAQTACSGNSANNFWS